MNVTLKKNLENFAQKSLKYLRCLNN